jgi:GNAT superfamily N-acetyltransferase
VGSAVHQARCATPALSTAREPELLAALERYYDAVPRATARTETIGPFTLFVAERGWPFYARPRLGETTSITVEQVRRVLDRQRELSVPQQLEWVHEVTPSLEPAARGTGLPVQRCPLLVLGELRTPRPPEHTSIRMLGPDDPDLPQVRAAIDVGFAHGGTERGDVTSIERDRFAQANDTSLSQAGADLMSRGLLATAGAFDDTGAIGGGSHSPRGDVTEVMGVAVLPASRRRGIGAAITAALATDAHARGVETVFCSAQSEDVARVYASIGFRRVGTACIVEPVAG